MEKDKDGTYNNDESGADEKMNEKWITTERGAYSKIEDVNPPEHYTSDCGIRYLITKRKTIEEHHMYGHRICEVCDNPTGEKSIKYGDAEFCSVKCLLRKIDEWGGIID